MWNTSLDGNRESEYLHSRCEAVSTLTDEKHSLDLVVYIA
jgi:hypothetical protein